MGFRELVKTVELTDGSSLLLNKCTYTRHGI